MDWWKTLRAHSCNLSVIVHDLDIERIAMVPAKADAPLIVDPNAVLTGAIPDEFLQAV